MSSNAVAIAAIFMSGLLLCVIAWQLLAIARTAVGRDKASRGRPHDQFTSPEGDNHN